MRLIGHLADEPTARRFGDYLYVQGIDNQLENQSNAGWGIWVSDEDKLEQASELLKVFRQAPADPKYQSLAKTAAGLRAGEEKDKTAYRKRLRNRWQLFRPLTPYGFGPLTFLLIAISVAVFIYSNFGEDKQPIMGLFITHFDVHGDYITWNSSLPEIRHGQFWRLLTPIFIHFGPLHILFNMLWLRDLGTMIEGRQSSLHLALLVVLIAVVSNLAQLFVPLSQGPEFGGMSGVIYGLLGYVWIRGKLDPGSGLYVHPTTVMMMIIWFVACFTPLTQIIGGVANVAHAAGLALGMVWGYFSSLRYR